VSWRWEDIDPDTLTQWQNRHAPTASAPETVDMWRAIGWGAVISTPAWATLYVAGRMGGVW